jgi:outer membrane protein OmpA-like peptidoglycan-associated protein
MKWTLFHSLILASLAALPAVCQDTTPKPGPAPLYSVTVVERDVDAVNYQYRAAEPALIDFRGTVLLPGAKGRATVESRRGRTQVDARFDNLESPSKFGPEYLSYVLWAISPEGAPRNLGEVIPGSNNHARLDVTTELQAFGMIVTAEPYSSVRQPSDVVVLENQVRPETTGSIKPIQAKYELLPRGHYTYNIQKPAGSPASDAPKVSMREYEALLELYQAQNALGIARAAEADKYASDTLAKAQREFLEAQRLQASKGDTGRIVQHAREAAQTADDARVIAGRRKQANQLAAAQGEALQARQAAEQAEASAAQARAEADAARAQIESERAAREQAEAEASTARQQADRLQAAEIPPPPTAPPGSGSPESQRALRNQLLERLNDALPARDTPRGLVVTVKDVDFSDLKLRDSAAERLARVARILASQPGLHVAVEGHTDTADTEGKSEERAAAVRNILVSGGLPGKFVSSQGYGNSRPVASVVTVSGRIENRRVEVVISGDPIGTLPVWERTYSLAPER